MQKKHKDHELNSKNEPIPEATPEEGALIFAMKLERLARLRMPIAPDGGEEVIQPLSRVTHPESHGKQ